MFILIADDEPIIRLGLQSMLEEMGHSVLQAANGREAIQLASRQEVDLAILDIKMPYTDGLQAAKTISRTNALPILLLTAFSDKDLVERATDLPIHGYLVKPVSPGELAAAISVAVKRFDETQLLREQSKDLEEKLFVGKLINRAKARLMAGGLSEEEAHREIQRRARESRQSMGQVSKNILLGE